MRLGVSVVALALLPLQSAAVADAPGPAPGTVARITTASPTTSSTGRLSRYEVDGQPGGHYLWGLAMRSSRDGLTVGVGGGDSSAKARRWDGTAWTPTQPVGGHFSELFGVDVLPSGIGWAVGDIGTNALAERWDGHAWALVPTPPPDPGFWDTLLSVSVAADDDVWAVGQTREIEGDSVLPLTEHWNGKHWKKVPSPQPPNGANGGLTGVDAISSTDVWAVGPSRQVVLLEHWNGKAWRLDNHIRGPEEKYLEAGSISAVSANDIWAIGSNGDATETLTLHWNGRAWKRFAAPAGRLPLTLPYAVDAVSHNDVWAAGCTAPPGVGCGRTMIWHWDGGKWTRVPSPNAGTNTGLFAISAASADDIWAVGYYSTDGEQTLRNFYVHWNGKTWTRY